MLGSSNLAVQILGAMGGLAALIAAVVGFLVYQVNRNSARQGEQVNLLAAGQISISAALDRSDKENERLRVQVVSLQRQVSDLQEQVRGLQNDHDA